MKNIKELTACSNDSLNYSMRQNTWRRNMALFADNYAQIDMVFKAIFAPLRSRRKFSHG